MQDIQRRKRSCTQRVPSLKTAGPSNEFIKNMMKCEFIFFYKIIALPEFLAFLWDYLFKFTGLALSFVWLHENKLV